MKQIKLMFDDGKIELHMDGQEGLEWIDYADLKQPICDFFRLPLEISSLALDFETEQLSYELNGTTTEESKPGLAEQEREIFAMLGYEYADLGNVTSLVNGLISGQISEELFQILLGIEGMQNEKNPGIEAFLETLEDI